MSTPQWAIVDEFIVDTGDSTGSGAMRGYEYTVADVRAWAARQGYDVNIDQCLTAHRQSPRKRAFTSQRIGMGPKSFYRVVEEPKGLRSKALLEMHVQQGQEMVNRWANERRFRMTVLARRNKRAREILELAETEVALVAKAMHARLSLLEGEDGEE